MLTVAAGKHYKIIGDYNSYVILNSIGRYLENLIENSTQKLIKIHLINSQDEWKLYLRFLSTLGKCADPMFVTGWLSKNLFYKTVRILFTKKYKNYGEI